MSDMTMRDMVAHCRDVPCADLVDGERKLSGFDIGLAGAVSVGLMVAARVVNVMAGWI